MKDYKLSEIKAICAGQTDEIGRQTCKICPIQDVCFKLTRVPAYWQIDEEEQDDE